MVDKYSAADLQNAGRLKQMRMVAGLVNQQNRKALPITFGSAAAIIVVFVIVGVVLHITRMIGVRKLSQNKTAADRAGVIAGEAQDNPALARQMASPSVGTRQSGT